ncbi:WD40-repeat-containing domain protein [Zopfochytrium polystomum]|nr:WD40-repeat-containing domain protein [Zopfochytrium polystomum]
MDRDGGNDVLSTLPSEIVDRTLAFIGDARSLARLGCVSKLWSSHAAADAHWRRLFLERWPAPNVAPLPINEVEDPPTPPPPWKLLYQHRLVLHDRWTQRTPIVKHFPAANLIVAIDPVRIVTAAPDGTLRVLRRDNAACIQTLVGHTDPIRSADVSDDGRLVVSASYDRVVRLWDAESGRCVRSIEMPDTLPTHVRFVARNGDRFVTATLEGTVSVWDRTRTRWRSTRTATEVAVLHPDGSVALWNWASRETRDVVAPHAGPAGADRAGAVRFDGRRIAVKRMCEAISVWDARSGALVAEIPRSKVSTPAMLALDGGRIAWLTTTSVEVWDIESKRRLHGQVCGVESGEKLFSHDLPVMQYGHGSHELKRSASISNGEERGYFGLGLWRGQSVR